jgi:hypothetical protein
VGFRERERKKTFFAGDRPFFDEFFDDPGGFAADFGERLQPFFQGDDHFVGPDHLPQGVQNDFPQGAGGRLILGREPAYFGDTVEIETPHSAAIFLSLTSAMCNSGFNFLDTC